MDTVKSHEQTGTGGASIFALLIDDINKMTASEQKLLWMKINKKKLSTYAKELDASVVPHNLSADEIDELIREARKNGKQKKG